MSVFIDVNCQKSRINRNEEAVDKCGALGLQWAMIFRTVNIELCMYNFVTVWSSI